MGIDEVNENETKKKSAVHFVCVVNSLRRKVAGQAVFWVKKWIIDQELVVGIDYLISLMADISIKDRFFIRRSKYKFIFSLSMVQYDICTPITIKKYDTLFSQF